MRRSLSLRREILSVLATDELATVAGGSHLCLPTGDCTHASVDSPCRTVPVNECLTLKPGCSIYCTV